MSDEHNSDDPGQEVSHRASQTYWENLLAPSSVGECLEFDEEHSGPERKRAASRMEPPPPLTRAPDFPLTLTRALLETMDLSRILHVILTGATAGDGLGFNRAFLWLEDDGERALRGQLAIGPASQEEARRIWEAMEAEQFNLARVMARYDAFVTDPKASRLTRTVEQVSVPLPVRVTTDGDGHSGKESFVGLLDKVISGRCALVRNQSFVPIPSSDLVLSRFALVPLLLSERAIGILAVDNPFNERPITPLELHDLQTLANLAAVAVERARLYERLRRMAEVDGLTGLLNRRSFDERLAELFADARRHAEPLAVLIMDADRFKEVNDRHGHLAGDDLLRSMAAVLTSRLRQGDVAARYGGDELVAILPRATGSEALAVAEYLCATVRDTPLGADAAVQTSVSIGVAELQPCHLTPMDLLGAADQALYEAKHAGRDQARFGGQQAPGPSDSPGPVILRGL